jgi:hypothetical protein
MPLHPFYRVAARLEDRWGNGSEAVNLSQVSRMSWMSPGVLQLLPHGTPHDAGCMSPLLTIAGKDTNDDAEAADGQRLAAGLELRHQWCSRDFAGNSRRWESRVWGSGVTVCVCFRQRIEGRA